MMSQKKMQQELTQFKLRFQLNTYFAREKKDRTHKF
jgi:hypothetical protein